MGDRQDSQMFSSVREHTGVRCGSNPAAGRMAPRGGVGSTHHRPGRLSFEFGASSSVRTKSRPPGSSCSLPAAESNGHI